MSEHIQITKADGILTLVVNRPSKKNALTEEMYGALADALNGAQGDDGVRVVLIRGEGDLFSAGNDVGEFAAVAMGGAEPKQVGRFLHALAAAEKPLLAAVQGRAVGVGTTLLLHCDLVVLAEDAQLTTPFVNLALVPEAGSSLLLPEQIGYQRAFAMFALGEPLGAQEALACGLAYKVVEREALASVAEDLARRLAAQPLGAVLLTRRLMRDPERLHRRIDKEAELFMGQLKTEEAKEAFTAFAERRAPDFSKCGRS